MEPKLLLLLEEEVEPKLLLEVEPKEVEEEPPKEDPPEEVLAGLLLGLNPVDEEGLGLKDPLEEDEDEEPNELNEGDD